MPDLSDLISRVEKASGPDRIIDIDVFRSLGAPLPDEFLEQKIDLEWDEVDLCFVMPLDGMRIRYEPPHYTSSLDAVLTLLPEGWWWSAGVCRRENHASVGSEIGTVEGELIFETFGATAPLALLSAILRARQAMQMEASS